MSWLSPGASVKPQGPDVVLVSQIMSRVLVTMEDLSAFDGIIQQVDENTIVMVDCVHIAPGGSPRSKVDGRMLLPRGKILYIQNAAPRN